MISLGWFLAGLATFMMFALLTIFIFAGRLLSAEIKKLKERLDIVEGKDPALREIADLLAKGKERP